MGVFLHNEQAFEFIIATRDNGPEFDDYQLLQRKPEWARNAPAALWQNYTLSEWWKIDMLFMMLGAASPPP